MVPDQEGCRRRILWAGLLRAKLLPGHDQYRECAHDHRLRWAWLPKHKQPNDSASVVQLDTDRLERTNFWSNTGVLTVFVPDPRTVVRGPGRPQERTPKHDLRGDPLHVAVDGSRSGARGSSSMTTKLHATSAEC